MESYKEEWVVLISGTDSRLGIGFRLGPNADFQYQIELGPQTRTQAIGPDAPAPEASKKRHVNQPQNQLGSVLPSKDKPHWIYTWNNINPSNKDTVPLDLDSTQQSEMVNGIHYGGIQGNHVTSHLYKLYQQSTINKQNSASTTPPPNSITKETHRLAPPRNRIEQTNHVTQKPPVDHATLQQSVDSSTIHPHVHKTSSNVNTVTLIPLEKPKQVSTPSSQLKGDDKSETEKEDQDVKESENKNTVSESETEDRISHIHTLTHSQFIQRVPASQVVQKIPSKNH